MMRMIAVVCACVLMITTDTLAKQRNPAKKALAIAETHRDTAEFKVNWCRQRMSRYDFKSRLQSCLNEIPWESAQQPSFLDTDPGFTYITLNIKPAGHYSSAIIQSVSKLGQKKTIGGDAFRVYVKGPTSLSATVIDRHDGTYEAFFLVMVPGIYSITVILDYTMCKGIKDPPFDWFARGNYV